MKIYFLRHGDSGLSASSDFDRELTDKGELDSTNIGLFCKTNKIYFTHALVSPLTRAKQTARLVLSELPPVPQEETEFLTPGSDPKNLFNLLRSFTNESRILCVTHEPFVSTCISTLICGGESSHIVMKTSSFAFIETDGIPGRGNGKLHWFVNPDVIHSQR